MRDKLIHDYFGVDLRVVWDSVASDIPDLLPVIRRILGEQSRIEGEGKAPIG